MSTSRLPIGHPLLQAQPGAAKDPFELARQIVQSRRGWAGPLGMTMKDPGDDPDPNDPDPDDPDDDDVDWADPDSKIKIGDKAVTVGKVKSIMAREKRQGKKAGVKALLDKLGFETEEELEAALESGGAPSSDPSDDDPDDGKGKKQADPAAARAAAERDRKLREREASAVARERVADIKAELVSQGVAREDLDDAVVLVDRKLDRRYDEDDLEAEVEALKERRPALFGDEEEEGEKPARRTGPALPKGGGTRKKPQQQSTFGAAGIERAKRRWPQKATS